MQSAKWTTTTPTATNLLVTQQGKNKQKRWHRPHNETMLAKARPYTQRQMITRFDKRHTAFGIRHKALLPVASCSDVHSHNSQSALEVSLNLHQTASHGPDIVVFLINLLPLTWKQLVRRHLRTLLAALAGRRIVILRGQRTSRSPIDGSVAVQYGHQQYVLLIGRQPLSTNAGRLY